MSMMRIDNVIHDIRIALRRLAKAPGFTAVTVATLALAIGANTTTFSALNQFLLRPLPVDRPDELVFLNSGGSGTSQSYPNYLAFRDGTRALAGVFAVRITPVAMNLGAQNASSWGYEATGNYFDVLGVRAMLGRTFTPEDDTRSSPHAVIVLSYPMWKSRFASDPNVVGREAKINGLKYTVIGVTPSGFFGTERLLAPDFWVPMSMEPQLEPGNPWLDEPATKNIWVMGRLKPGVTAKQAEADLNGIAAERARTDRWSEGLKIVLSPVGLIGSALRGPVIGFASVLMGLASLVLVIACVNIAGMLLARAAERRKEISIRLALGASQGNLIRQLLTESLMLSVVGAGLGILIAIWILKLIAAIRPPINVPLEAAFPFDMRVLGFSVGLCFITTLLFGLTPAIQAARVDLLPALKNQLSERFRKVQLRDFLVGAQVALSLVLVVSTVLVVRSLQRAVTIDIGFNPHHAVAVAFDVALSGYNEERGKVFERQLMEQLKAIPGLDSVALSSSLPLSVGQSSTSVYAEGGPIPKPADRKHPYYYSVTPGFFHTMQTRLVAGREFDDRDRVSTPRVVIVNEALAHQLYPNGSALGKRLSQGGAWAEIVGIAQDGKYQSLNDTSEPAIFWPRAQHYESFFTIVARSSRPAEDLLRMVQQTVHSLDGGLPFFQAGTLEEHLDFPLMPARIAATMLGGFGLLAAVLAATGVYGTLAYAISRRTREIGIRVAIGANRSNVLSLVLRRAFVTIAAASGLGALLALSVGKFFSPILYGVSPRDPGTYALALGLMAVIGLIACYVPARRALRIEPSVALRDE